MTPAKRVLTKRVEVRKIGDKFRLVRAGTNVPAKHERVVDGQVMRGAALDGGGHDFLSTADRQAKYVNEALERNRGKQG